MRADVLVIGAGVAGLVAARRIADGGPSVLVLEARQRVGGRTETVEAHGATIDLGGQWLGPGQDRAYDLASELGLETFAQWSEGSDVFVEGRRAIRLTDMPEAADSADLAALGDVVAELDRMAEQVPLDAPWSASEAASWDATTLESWLRARTDRGRTRSFVRASVEGVFATAPENLSLLHTLFYVRSGGGWASLVGVEGGAQQDRLSQGAQELSVRLSGRLGDAVRRSWPVRRIRHDPEGVTVSGEAGDASGRKAVVAIPPTLAGRIAYDTPLPAERDQLTQRLPAGSVIKFHVIYPSPWWRERGLSGLVTSSEELVGVTLDGSPPDGDVGIVTGFFEGPQAMRAGRMTREERERAVTEVLARGLGEDAATPVDYLERDWSAEEWTRGCYGAHMPPGAWTQLGPALREPVGSLHWAGSETASRWMGYIDGAIESGERAAQEVLEALD